MPLKTLLLATVLSLTAFRTVFCDNSQESCPYNGEKPKDLVDKLYSDEFLNSLSPFAQLLWKAIPSDDFFFKLFDTSFRNGTIKRTFFLNCVYWENKMGLDNPIALCKTMAEKVAKAFENNPSPLDYFKIAAGTLENSLKQENKLTNAMDENATNKLIESFISYVANYLCTPDVEGPVESLFAFDDGSIDFFRSIGVTDAKDVAFVATSFGNQFQKFATKPPMESCPYNGAKPKDLVDKLHSKEFRNGLSPFGKLFLKAIPSDDFFFKLFDTSFKKGTEKSTYFKNCVYWEVKMGLDCPIDLCKTMAGKVAKAFENNLTPLDYFIISTSTLESSLKQEGKLKNSMDEEATNEIIQSFLQHVAKYLCTSDVEGPVESLFAFDDGSIEFFQSIGATDKKDVAYVAKSFGNQFQKFAAPMESCPYSGEKPKDLVDKLHSEEFKSSLSPFNKLFLNAIPSDNFFFKLFDTSFKKGTAEDTYFLNCVYWEVKMGLDCPIDLCKTMAGNVAKAFKNNITPLDYFIVSSSTLESSLKQEGKLKNTMDEDATKEMIESFIRYISKYLCTSDVEGPVASLFAFDDGSIDFFRSIGATDEKDAAYVATSFGNQFAKFGNRDLKIIVVERLPLRKH